MIAMSVLLSKVDRRVSFSSYRLLMWKMVVERRTQKEDDYVFLKLNERKICCH